MSGRVLALIDIEDRDGSLLLIRETARLFPAAEIHVAHVIPYGFYSYIEPYISQESREAVISDAKAALSSILTAASAADATPHVLQGGVGEQALLLAKKLDVATITLCATRNDSAHTTLGTHAAQIARHAECSVFLIRGGA